MTTGTASVRPSQSTNQSVQRPGRQAGPVVVAGMWTAGVGTAATALSLVLCSGVIPGRTFWECLAPSFLAVATAAAVCVAAAWVARRRGDFTRLEGATVGLWMLCVAVRSWEIAADQWAGLGSPGTVLAVVAAALTWLLVRKHRVNRMTDKSAKALLWLDMLLSSLCWVLVMWRLGWGAQPPGVGGSNWPILVWTLAYCLVLAFVSMLAIERFNAASFALTCALFAGFVADVRTVYRPWGPADGVLQVVSLDASMWWMGVSACCTGYAVSMVMRGTWSWQPPLKDDHRRLLLSGVNAVMALCVATIDLVRDVGESRTGQAPVDVVACGVLVALMVVFSVRESVRGAYYRELRRKYGKMAEVDQLSNLRNRSALRGDLMRTRRGGESFGFAIIDVDKFKTVNEHYGHEAGDALVQALGATLNQFAEDAGRLTVYRLSGNEFALMVPGPVERVGYVTGSARQAMEQTLMAHHKKLRLSTSAGVTWIETPQLERLSAHQELSQANEALQVAKLRRNCVEHFTDDLAAAASRRQKVETNLRQAIHEKRLAFHCQPVVDLASGTVLGLELLARWEDNDLGRVSPGEFIPVAERTGLIVELGFAALDAAVEVVSWCSTLGYRLFVTVNVSPIQLRSPGFYEGVVARIERAQGASARDVKLELTESVFMDEHDPALPVVQRLGDYGFQIALDDLGSGFTSLAYLSQMPYHVVKLDRSVTTNLENTMVRAVVSALTSQKRGGPDMVVAEGVENPEMVAELQQVGVRFGQGFLWSNAVPVNQLEVVFERLGARTAQAGPSFVRPVAQQAVQRDVR